jgi:hypothetical protein
VLLPEIAAMAVTQPPETSGSDVLTHVALVLDHVPADDPVRVGRRCCTMSAPPT